MHNTARLIGNRQPKKDSACDIEDEITLTSFKNIVNTKTQIRVTWKA